MNIRQVAIAVVLVAAPLLFSCSPKKPAITGTAVPAGPLLTMLDQRRLAFTTLKAFARIDVVRESRKRSFDSVGIVLDGQRRMRLEAFGPLGQSVFALAWDGTEVFIRLQDDDKVKKPGQAGIERVTGISIDAKELCAILSGTFAVPVRQEDARAYCAHDGSCTLELMDGDAVRRIRTTNAQSAREGMILSLERYQADNLVYRVRYDGVDASFPIPMYTRLVLESPEKSVQLTVEYSEIEVNTPVLDGAFVLSDKEDLP